jgi:hypothetical protein
LNAADGKVLLSSTQTFALLTSQTYTVDLHSLPYSSIKLRVTLITSGETDVALESLRVFDQKLCGK